MASLAGKQSLIYVFILLAGILSFSWTEPSNCLTWHYAQYGMIVVLTAFWMGVSYKLIQKTPQQKQAELNKLNEAISIDNGKSGVTQIWYQDITNTINCLLISLITFLGTSMVHAVIHSYPNSPEFNITMNTQKLWDIAITKCSHKTLFMLIWVFDVIVYWIIGLAYSYIDFYRPPLLMPFKIQEDVFVNKENWIKAAKVAIRNQFIAIVLLYFFWDIYPLISPQGFDTQLPSLLDTIISLLIFIPFSEIYFYFFHRLFHQQWLYDHVHWFHHVWKAPIAISAIYVKPAEHILINLPSLIIGPFIMGSHVSIWYVYIVGSIMKRELAHCGYHFPGFYPADIHDFHHSAGTDNFGVMGVLDQFFGTNSEFNKSWQGSLGKRYFNVQYPMDKIIASNNNSDKGKKS